jgi:hypothetical protein
MVGKTSKSCLDASPGIGTRWNANMDLLPARGPIMLILVLTGDAAFGHWSRDVRVDVKDHTFFYHFDTFGSKKRTEIVRSVLKTTSLWRSGADWVSIDVPQQDEAGYDCGVWMLIYAAAVASLFFDNKTMLNKAT